MNTNDESRTDAGFGGDPLPSDNITPGQENAAPQQPQPEQEERTKPQNPVMYYEPWQEPVYRQTPGQGPYSPGLHGGTYTGHPRTPVVEQPPVKPKKSGRPWFLKAVSLVLICAIVSAGATYGVIRLASTGGSGQTVLGSTDSASVASATPAPASSPAASSGLATNLTTTGQEMSAGDIYDMAIQQVVGINSQAKTNVWGQMTSSPVSGSGFIISSDGYIVTNYHVIQYAVTQGSDLTVMMHDEESYTAKVVGYDQDNDLAVIKIDAADLSAATLGTNNDMSVGDQVYAVGNPLGELTYTMTSGIVSALDRAITEEDGSSINMFQIDAAVNPGNSGGPVYNDMGQVIGIVSAKYSSTGIEGLGFAIPIDDANDIVTQLMTNGRVTGKPSLGVMVSTVTSTAAQYYKMPEGAYVETVNSGSAAEKAGIQVGDVITKLGDTAVSSVEELKAALKEYKAGETTTIVINRQGEEMSLSITFDEVGVTQTASQGQPSFSERSSS